MSEPTQEQPAVTPEVTTRSPWHVSRIPAHLGRARTSTVVLAVLFLAIGALYLNIRPETTGAATTETGNTAPAVTTTAPPSEPAETTTSPAPETTEDLPTTTNPPTTSVAPTETTSPEGTTESSTPTPTGTPELPTPTVSSPTG
jgi:cytoskeletal protein RodZ